MEASSVGSLVFQTTQTCQSATHKITDSQLHPRALGEASTFRILNTQHSPLVLFYGFRIQKLCKFSPVIQTEMQKV